MSGLKMSEREELVTQVINRKFKEMLDEIEGIYRVDQATTRLVPAVLVVHTENFCQVLTSLKGEKNCAELTSLILIQSGQNLSSASMMEAVEGPSGEVH